MNYTDVSICSKALLKIGAQTITSFEDGTAEAEVAANLYPLVRDSLLSAYPWSFAIMQPPISIRNVYTLFHPHIVRKINSMRFFLHLMHLVFCQYFHHHQSL